MRGWVATTVATWLACAPAWGHRFPPSRSIVVQLEPCALVLLIAYRPSSGAPTEAILTRAASAPKSHARAALRDVLTAYAMRPLTVAVDGTPLVPTAVEAKVGVEPGGARPLVMLLVTYPLPAGGGLSIRTAEPRTTRISWQDRASGRVAIPDAPAQGAWHAGVASFLLSLAPPTGGLTCATRSSPSDSDSSSPPAR